MRLRGRAFGGAPVLGLRADPPGAPPSGEIMRLGLGVLLGCVMLLVAGAAHGQATLTIDLNAPEGYLIDGLRVFVSNTKDPARRDIYDIGIGRSVSVALGPPLDTGYRLSVLQTRVAVLTGCPNMETKALACVRGERAACGALTKACMTSLIHYDRYYRECGEAKGSSYRDCTVDHDPAACAALPPACLVHLVRVPKRMSVTNQGACNSNIAPADGKIVLALQCDKGQRACSCRIVTGKKIPSEADLACPLSCQSYNPASGHCIGPERDDCKRSR